MTETVSVKPELIRWAVARSRLPFEDLTKTFPKLEQWLAGERLPTIKQLEQLAHKTITSLGYLFLDDPPNEKLGIPDFRTVGDTPIGRPRSLSENSQDRRVACKFRKHNRLGTTVAAQNPCVQLCRYGGRWRFFQGFSATRQVYNPLWA